MGVIERKYADEPRTDEAPRTGEHNAQAPRSLADAFRRQAARIPDALAVIDRDREFRYRDIDALSDAAAEALLAAGVDENATVALCLPRGWQLVCCMLALRKLGALAVPLDRQSPRERLAYILDDAAAGTIIADEADRALLPESARPVLRAEDLFVGPREGLPPRDRRGPSAESHPSFLFYTSGTTGRPKGVEVYDRGILRLAVPGYIDIAEGDRFSSISNPAFDAISFEVWTPLICGGCCVVFDDEIVQSPDAFERALRRRPVDTMFMTVALFNAIGKRSKTCLDGVGQIMVGGEQLNVGLIRDWYAANPHSRTRLFNIYGPTESATFALCHPIPRDFSGEVIPIGRVLAGTEAVLVADGARLARPGEVAELYLAGDGLARGYRNLPEETARAFVALPWLDGGSGRYYKTGDLVRADDTASATRDAAIEYVGRVDRQVKVRGFRVEPGEIERVLTTHPAIEQACVCAFRPAADAPYELHAYLILRAALDFEALLAHAERHLPQYMRPHGYHRIEAFPLNRNGKIDQDALRASPPDHWGRDLADERVASDRGTNDGGLNGDAAVDGSTGDPAARARLREVLALAARHLSGVVPPRPEDTWVRCGGDSLKALAFRFDAIERWGEAPTQSEILRFSFAEIAAATAAATVATRDSTAVVSPELAVDPEARSAPATSEQTRLWLLQQREPDSTAYTVALAFRIEGRVDFARLRAVCRGVVGKHPALRTAFAIEGGELRQLAGATYDPCHFDDNGRDGNGRDGNGRDGNGSDSNGRDGAEYDWRVRAMQCCREPFDLSNHRLLHIDWLPLAPETGVLLIRTHHIAVDGWSLNLLFEEISAACRGQVQDTTAPAPSMLDYGRWQRLRRETPRYRELRRAAAPAALRDTGLERLPRSDDREDAAHARTPAKLEIGALDAASCAALARIGCDHGATRFQMFAMLYGAAIHAVTGMERFLIASPTANRPLPALANCVGMFSNTVLMAYRAEPLRSVHEALMRQIAAVREALETEEVALADRIEDAGVAAAGRDGLFDFMLVVENTEFARFALPDCRATPEWGLCGQAKCALTLSVIESADGLQLHWEYDPAAFRADTVEAMQGLIENIIAALDGGADRRLRDLIAPLRWRTSPMLHGADEPPLFDSVYAGFARRARTDADAIALVRGGERWSYARLDAWATRLSEALLVEFGSHAAGSGRFSMALWMPPSIEHVVAMLALARANITIVPLDTKYPRALIAEILRQCAPACVLTLPGGEAAEDIGGWGLPLREVRLAEISGTGMDGAREASAGGDVATAPMFAGRPLYTLFTSGSTGAPKGVDVSDWTLCNLLQWQTGAGGMRARATTMQYSMLSFDVSFQEIFGTLCAGGELHLIAPEWRIDHVTLLEYMRRHGIERVFMPYVALQMLAKTAEARGVALPRLREVISAGEALICTEAIRAWFATMPQARLFNHYGPTETHVITGLRLPARVADWPDMPAIGAPVSNARLLIVDDCDLPVPAGRAGHLLLGGPMAIRCYPWRPDLNAERFVDIAESPDPRMNGSYYRSGDLARLDPDGGLRYLARADAQIKLSGHRLEPGQVEAVLMREPGIVAAVVEKAVEGEWLRAYLHCAARPPMAEALDARLALALPGHIRIRDYLLIEAMPRTASGKIDRARVADMPRIGSLRRDTGRSEPNASTAAAWDVSSPKRSPAETSPAKAGSLQPGASQSGMLESRLAALFEDAVGMTIAPEQSFFAAGATSLSLMRFHQRCTSEAGLDFGIADLFEHVSIRRLAAAIEGRGTGAAARRPSPERGERVAIVGMAVNLPGAADLRAYWEMIVGAGSGIEYFDAAPGMVGARSQMAGLLEFDPQYFGIGLHEARLMDPQQRQFLMAAVQALAHAGIAGEARHRTGVIASCGENTYYPQLIRAAARGGLPDAFQMAMHQDKDFLATKTAYHLDLRGPAFTLQAACSSSLIAVHVAAGMILRGECECMLAGGVLVDTLLSEGYTHKSQHIFSADGRCRPFSDDADGTVGGSGVAVVALKRLDRALDDGDTVYATIAASAVNNDGAGKLSYSAPSVGGQRDAIRAARMRLAPDTPAVRYVEAHGTGTRLGDPVEVSALRQAYDFDAADAADAHESAVADAQTAFALSSVKSQIGHLGAAAGAVGLVRATLAVHRGIVPPNPGFRRLNPQIGTDGAGLRVPVEAVPWPGPRAAGVSSFGIGGSNAHVIVAGAEDAECTPHPVQVSAPPCLLLSSRSREALLADARRVAAYLEAAPQEYPRVLRHLQAGREQALWRAGALCADVESAIRFLRDFLSDPSPAAIGEPQAALSCAEMTPEQILERWRAGHVLQWPSGSAQPPWDFPPPAFHTRVCDLRPLLSPPGRAPATADGTDADTIVRLPEKQWLSRPEWLRLRRIGAHGAGLRASALVVLNAQPWPERALAALRQGFEQVVEATAGESFAEDGEGRYRVDPADPTSLSRLFDALAARGIRECHWLHALPLAIEDAFDAEALWSAQWACLDTPAAVANAAAGRLAIARMWLISAGAQALRSAAVRPAAGLLAGACAVIPQECAIEALWLDLPAGDARSHAESCAAGVLAMRTETLDAHRRYALRDGYLWRQALIALPTAPVRAAIDHGGGGVVVLGSGGVGAAIAEKFLRDTACKVLLVSRRGLVPERLRGWGDRISALALDFARMQTAEDAAEAVLAHASRPSVLVHAAGSGAGGAIARRNPRTAAAINAVKLHAALLMETLIARTAPALAVYCSSMASMFGGLAHYDYAACNGLLDALAGSGDEASARTARVSIGWDVWRESGMAADALRGDARHRRHLQFGLTTVEAQRVFAAVLDLGLPQVSVSTVELDQARGFYAPTGDGPDSGAKRNGVDEGHAVPDGARMGGVCMDDARTDAADEASLRDFIETGLCGWLGVDAIAHDAPLYELGADSLIMLDLIEAVRKRYGRTLSLSRFGHRVSIARIAELLADDARSAPTQARSGRAAVEVAVDVWRRGAAEDAGPMEDCASGEHQVLCLIHPIGGDVQAYRDLAEALDPRISLCAIADPALTNPVLTNRTFASEASSDAEPAADAAPRWSIETRAERYLEALREVFPRARWSWQLCGWSFGALVATAMAAKLEAEGMPAAGLHLIDPPAPESLSRFADLAERDAEDIFARELRHHAPQWSGDAAGLPVHAQAYVRRLAACCRRNAASMAAFAPPRIADTPCTLFLAAHEMIVSGMGAHEAGVDGSRGQEAVAHEPAAREFAAVRGAEIAAWRGSICTLGQGVLVDADHYGIVGRPQVERVAAAIAAAVFAPVSC